MIKISVMTLTDTAFAVELTDIEKWGYLKDDFERLIYFEPEGCFVAWHGNKKVGMVTTTSYDHYAFIGCLIVRQEYRSRGIGEMLMKHAIDYLHKKDVRTVELDGVFSAVSLYKRLGFRDKYLSLRFCRKPKKISGMDQPETVKSVDDIVKFDKNKTGLNRAMMLRKYHEQMPELMYIEKQYNTFAYAIVRLRAGELSTIGPMVCENKSHAEKILKSIIIKHGEKLLSIGVPEINHKAVDLLTQNGFQYQPPSLRMYLGEKIDCEKHIYGIFSPEKG